MYFTLPFYRAMIERSGYEDDVRAFDAAMKDGDTAAAAAAISDRYLDRLAAIGTPDVAAASVRNYRDCGATSPCVGGITKTDFDATLEALAGCLAGAHAPDPWALRGAVSIMGGMEGSARESVGTQSAWLRCYRCWSRNLEVQLHYEGILKVDSETGEAVEPVEEVQEAVVQCLDCLHDQPHLGLTFYEENGRRVSRIEPIEDRWERMVTGTPWVASCTVTVDADQVESCSGPDAADSLAFAAFGDHGTREFFTHVRFHKHEEERIVIHMLVELYSRSSDEATEVMEQAARGALAITSLAEESRPPPRGRKSSTSRSRSGARRRRAISAATSLSRSCFDGCKGSSRRPRCAFLRTAAGSSRCRRPAQLGDDLVGVLAEQRRRQRMRVRLPPTAATRPGRADRRSDGRP